jgi:DNA helicase-2/ATP-dependent DNA helicase PcrA
LPGVQVRAWDRWALGPQLDEDYVILWTIHSAKGQEWKSVFVLNVVDGCIPSDLGADTTAEIEEERRLLYGR